VSQGGLHQPRPTPRVGARFSLADQARLAGVSASRIRSWTSYGLVPTARGGAKRNGFRVLARLRLLGQLDAAGFAPAKLARALASARAFVADDDAALHGLLTAPQGRILAIRLPNGQITDPCGQRIFDFDAVPSAPKQSGKVLGLRSPQDWFELGVEAEHEHRLEHAISAYQRALPQMGAPAWFNLGNCRAELGDAIGAIDAFQQALRVDPGYSAAWNNLGIAQGTLHRVVDAMQSFCRALELAPHYADAHYNLADVLATAGDIESARKHWRAYLAYDPNSRWADHVRRRLRDGDAG
jgi:tetratricopeptide (TPR) repeat protein